MGNTGVAGTILQITQGYAAETCVTKSAQFEPRNSTTAQIRAVSQSDGLLDKLEDVGFGTAGSLGSLCIGRVDIAKG
jgi:hypothetical protein